MMKIQFSKFSSMFPRKEIIGEKTVLDINLIQQEVKGFWFEAGASEAFKIGLEDDSLKC